MTDSKWWKIRGGIMFFFVCLSVLVFAGTTQAVELKILGLEDGATYTQCDFPEISVMVTTGEGETGISFSECHVDGILRCDWNGHLYENTSTSDALSNYLSAATFYNYVVAPGDHTLKIVLSWLEGASSTSVTVTYTVLEPPNITLEGEYTQSVCDMASIMNDLNISGKLCGDSDHPYLCYMTFEKDGMPDSKVYISHPFSAGSFDWAYEAPPLFLNNLLTPGIYKIGLEIFAEYDSTGQYSPLPEPYPSAYLTIETVQYCGGQVSIDIKPGSCPNPLNVKSKGVLPVAVLGTNEFNVQDIDVATIRLIGIAPLRSGLEDVGTPSEPGVCNNLGPDGIMDLTLKFSTQEIVEALGDVEDGDEVTLTLTGILADGTKIEGEDLVTILKRGKSKGKEKGKK